MKNLENSKLLAIIRIILAIAILVLALLQIINVWDKAIYIFEPLMGVLLLLQAVQFWNQSRNTAIINLCAALFVFVCCFVIFL